jgi:sec-independent protein translocase protein TatB
LFLLIFESIGTAELVFIGIIALIFLGPRRMPDMARKLGKLMADLRGTANDFKQTWEREVNFEEENRMLRGDDLEPFELDPVARETVNEHPAVPEIKPAEFDREKLEKLEAARTSAENGSGGPDVVIEEVPETDPLADKRTWL